MLIGNKQTLKIHVQNASQNFCFFFYWQPTIMFLPHKTIQKFMSALYLSFLQKNASQHF